MRHHPEDRGGQLQTQDLVDDTRSEADRGYHEAPSGYDVPEGHDDRGQDVDGQGYEDSATGYRSVPTDAFPTQQTGEPARQAGPGEGAMLFNPEQVDRFRGQWQAIQTAFVDDPQSAVRGADHLVAEVMQTLAATFADHKRDLEGQWRSGDQTETEELRLALHRYRSFFHQLLHS